MEGTTGRAPSIMVVEDEELLLEAVITKLSKMGFRVVGARSVDQAIDFLNNIGPVDAVWLDHYLPERTGDALVIEMKKNPAWANIPIYLVTNSISPAIVNGYMKLGISQYYVKLLTKMETIINMIAAELQQRRIGGQ